jgi:hypothetical protein
MNTNDAVSTYQLVARLTVEVCLPFLVFGAKQSLLERRNEGGHGSSQGVQVNDFVWFEIVPFQMGFDAALANKPASAAKASCFAFLALVAHCLFAGAHFLEGILDVEEVVDVEGSLEPRDPAHWQWSVLATLWTWETLSLSSPTYQTLQALLAIHVETLEQPRLFVGLQTYPTGDLVLDLLESFLGSSGGFGSHGSVSSGAAGAVD